MRRDEEALWRYCQIEYKKDAEVAFQHLMEDRKRSFWGWLSRIIF